MQSGILLLLLLLLCFLPELVFSLLSFLVFSEFFILAASSIAGARSLLTFAISFTSRLCSIFLASASGGDVVGKPKSVVLGNSLS